MLNHVIDPPQLLLIAGVSLQAAALAYIYDPSTKALLYGLPIPFTLSTLAIQRPIDATNVLGLILLLMFTYGIRALHNTMRINIIVSITTCALAYCIVGYLLAIVIPPSPNAFWASSLGVFTLGMLLFLTIPPKEETGHKSSLPLWIKLPVIVIVVVALMNIKDSLHGFTTVFPMVGVIGAYESRHSLWTLGRQIPRLILTLVPLMVTTQLLTPALGLPTSLALGWVVFLAILIPLTRLAAKLDTHK